MAVPAFDLEHCLAQVEARGVTLLESTKTLDGWTQAKTKGIPNTMSIFEHKNESSLITVRGEIDNIQAPAYDVAKWINSLESLPVLDKMAKVKEARIVEEFNERTCVMYCPYAVPWPLDTRDFVWFQDWKSLPTGEELLYGFSVTRSDVPERAGHVRGVIFDSGYAIRPTSENTCRISYIVCIDPMGWVPAWINTKTAEQAYCLHYTKEYFDQNPVKVSSKPSSPSEAQQAPIEAPPSA